MNASLIRTLAVAMPLALAVPLDEARAQAPKYVPADVEFMQGMIGHHAQALDMCALVSTRTRNQSIHLLAQRIDISQKDEIRRMRNWLADRGQPIPGGAEHDDRGHHGAGHDPHLMPGMLTAEQMAQLAAARDADFDRLFLRLMIQHHEGALTMVKTLFSSPGAAQETPTFRYASDVDTDQRIEIERMRKLLAAMPASTHS
jgi:uncharacterized protein (DUF305 family)